MESTGKRNGGTGFRGYWPLAVLGLGVLALLAYRWTLEGAGRAVGRVAEHVVGIAEGFRSGTITRTFHASLPELRGTGSGNLELATSTVTETLASTDERRVLWDMVSLGQNVAEIRVGVTYRYHVSLDDPWNLEVSGQTCVVHAPAIRPSLPPAIHTDRMEKRTSSGWLRFDADDQLEALERSLTPTLSSWAGDRRHLEAVRETCRRTVADFVRGWLLREDQWHDDRFNAIVVFFDDEESSARRPTLTLEERAGEENR